MLKQTKVIIAVLAAGVLIASGVAAAYVLAPPLANPCAGQPSTTSAGSAAAPAAAPAAPQATAPPPTTYWSAAIASSPRAGASITAPPSSYGEIIHVVAAENFWGSLVSQIGGVHTSVVSIVSDPNTDPHEYQANETDAIEITDAQYVILNNVGYDTWATQIVAADGNSNQTILNIGDYLGVSVTGGIVTGNPHLWYNPNYVLQAVAWMYDNLTTIAPSLTAYFTEQYDNLTASLDSLYANETRLITDNFAGTEVASTESIFVYMANYTHLDLVSPPAFMMAIAEGNDPPDSSVVTFTCQLESGAVKVLVYNIQTVTPITTTMKAIAAEYNVSTTYVSETIQPPTESFQEWMGAEIQYLFQALDANALGQ